MVRRTCSSDNKSGNYHFCGGGDRGDGTVVMMVMVAMRRDCGEGGGGSEGGEGDGTVDGIGGER